MDGKTLTIGRAARSAGVHVETIRYYQRRGLLPRPGAPTRSGIRRYPPELVDQVRFIKRAQQLGFPLRDVAELLALAQGNSCSATCGVAERKLYEVERKIADLERVQVALRSMVTGCRATRAEDPCPLVNALAGKF